jgi:membrane protein implicated in regulation of membrane protease activity
LKYLFAAFAAVLLVPLLLTLPIDLSKRTKYLIIMSSAVIVVLGFLLQSLYSIWLVFLQVLLLCFAVSYLLWKRTEASHNDGEEEEKESKNILIDKKGVNEEDVEQNDLITIQKDVVFLEGKIQEEKNESEEVLPIESLEEVEIVEEGFNEKEEQLLETYEVENMTENMEQYKDLEIEIEMEDLSFINERLLETNFEEDIVESNDKPISSFENIKDNELIDRETLLLQIEQDIELTLEDDDIHEQIEELNILESDENFEELSRSAFSNSYSDHTIQPLSEEELYNKQNELNNEDVELYEGIEIKEDKEGSSLTIVAPLLQSMHEQLLSMQFSGEYSKFEQTIEEILEFPLPDYEYYRFACLLRDHYIEKEDYDKLFVLLKKLQDKLKDNAKLLSEITYYMEQYC